MLTYARRVLDLVLSFYTTFAFRGKKVFLVTGMRRSGNHAFISWITNALNEEECELDYSRNHFFGTVPSGTVVHINEVNAMGILNGIAIIKSFFNEIRRADYIIISREDCYPEDKNFLVPRSAREIYIRRRVLNLVASRIKGLQSSAERGIGLLSFNVDSQLMQKLAAWDSRDVLTWHYDRWLSSADYRAQFLCSLGLKHDILPSVSYHGRGSSFSDRSGIPENTDTRFRQIKWNSHVVELLLCEKYIHLLDEGEKEFLDTNCGEPSSIFARKQLTASN